MEETGIARCIERAGGDDAAIDVNLRACRVPCLERSGCGKCPGPADGQDAIARGRTG